MLSMTTASACAFAPISVMPTRSSVRMTVSAEPEPTAVLTGKAFAETMPGVTGPLGFFVRRRKYTIKHHSPRVSPRPIGPSPLSSVRAFAPTALIFARS